MYLVPTFAIVFIFKYGHVFAFIAGASFSFYHYCFHFHSPCIIILYVSYITYIEFRIQLCFPRVFRHRKSHKLETLTTVNQDRKNFLTHQTSLYNKNWPLENFRCSNLTTRTHFYNHYNGLMNSVNFSPFNKRNTDASPEA